MARILLRAQGKRLTYRLLQVGRGRFLVNELDEQTGRHHSYRIRQEDAAEIFAAPEADHYALTRTLYHQTRIATKARTLRASGGASDEQADDPVQELVPRLR